MVEQRHAHAPSAYLRQCTHIAARRAVATSGVPVCGVPQSPLVPRGQRCAAEQLKLARRRGASPQAEVIGGAKPRGETPGRPASDKLAQRSSTGASCGSTTCWAAYKRSPCSESLTRRKSRNVSHASSAPNSTDAFTMEPYNAWCTAGNSSGQQTCPFAVQQQRVVHLQPQPHVQRVHFAVQGVREYDGQLLHVHKYRDTGICSRPAETRCPHRDT